MPFTKIQCADEDGPKEPISKSACQECALSRLNGCDYPAEVIVPMVDHAQDRQHISVTRLNNPCARQVALQSTTDYVLSPHDLWAAHYGTMLHKAMELEAQLDTVAEARFWAPHPTWPGRFISGTPDLIYYVPTTKGRAGVIRDYKSPAEAPDKVKQSTKEQLWMLRWLVDHAVGVGDAVPEWDENGNQLMSPDWEPLNVYKPDFWLSLEVVYLTKPGVVTAGITKYKKIDIRDDEWVENYIIPRYAELSRALHDEVGYLPPPPKGWEYTEYGDWPKPWAWLCRYCPVVDECLRLQREEGR